MEESKIISTADVLSNQSEFTRLLTMILGENVCYKKFHQQYHNPTNHQFDMIDEYKEFYMDYKNKEVCMITSHR